MTTTTLSPAAVDPCLTGAVVEFVLRPGQDSLSALAADIAEDVRGLPAQSQAHYVDVEVDALAGVAARHGLIFDEVGFRRLVAA